jgi:hypothetical protein
MQLHCPSEIQKRELSFLMENGNRKGLRLSGAVTWISGTASA